MPKLKCTCGTVAFVSEAEMRRDAGRKMKCPDCGRIAKLPDAVPTLTVIADEADGPVFRELPQRRPRWHPTKVMMLVATAGWPFLVAILSVLSFFGTTGNLDSYGGGYIDYGTGRIHSWETIAGNSIVGGFIIGTALYLCAMFILGVVWFATKSDNTSR